MSMIRSIMRSAARKMGKHPAENQSAVFGAVRAGMHQKAEHAYEHTLSGAAVPGWKPDETDAVPEKMTDDSPNEEIRESSGEETAENVAVITPDAELLDEVSAEETEPEEPASEADKKEETEQTFSVDYSAEQIPVLDPLTGGVECEPRPLIYEAGDGSAKEISLTAVTRETVHPVFPQSEFPSANVPAMPEDAEAPA